MEEHEAISKLWSALINVEDYFQNGIISQLRESTVFGGEDAIPIKNAHIALKTTGPFLSVEMSSFAESCIETAASEFNKLLETLRTSSENSAQEEAIRLVRTQLGDSLEVFRKSLLPLRQAIPEAIAAKTPTTISISGDVYGQMNVAGESMYSPSLNITLHELIEKIDSSEADEDSKEEIKGKIRDILRHPIVSAILGGASGAILS